MSGCQKINLGILRVLETFSRVFRETGKRRRAKEVGSPIFQVFILSSEIFLLDLFQRFIFLPTTPFCNTFSIILKYLKITKIGSF